MTNTRLSFYLCALFGVAWTVIGEPAPASSFIGAAFVLADLMERD